MALGEELQQPGIVAGVGPINDSSPDEGELPLETVSKKPYQKPAFRCEPVFETTALSCGKNGTQGQCHSGRGLS